jgi:transposase
MITIGVDVGGQLKNARSLATRYDKTADSYLGFIHIVSIRLWMRQFVNAS